MDRERGPLVIGFLDIDLFKDINDRHGHAVGDQVLVAVARALRSAVRSQDQVVRMGGEEFLLLMPGMPARPRRPAWIACASTSPRPVGRCRCPGWR